MFLLGKLKMTSLPWWRDEWQLILRSLPSVFVFLLQAMCLYYGIPHQQQGPFSMPGTTRCHVNMAGYSSSSCIFCCFNEWGKFCQAHTTSRRYGTCVLSYLGVTHSRTHGAVGCATVPKELLYW